MNDPVNEFLEKAACADGFIFGSPVHFASASGMLTSFMDRVFSTNFSNDILSYKPAAAISSSRRGGNTATFDQINKYFTISNMPVVSSQYWNMLNYILFWNTNIPSPPSPIKSSDVPGAGLYSF